LRAEGEDNVAHHRHTTSGLRGHRRIVDARWPLAAGRWPLAGNPAL
jgi:hypothetical protein